MSECRCNKDPILRDSELVLGRYWWLHQTVLPELRMCALMERHIVTLPTGCVVNVLILAVLLSAGRCFQSRVLSPLSLRCTSPGPRA